MKIRQKIFNLIDEDQNNSKGDAFVHYFISALIIINVFALFLESYENINADYKTIFWNIEIFSIVIFSIEYIIRIWTADLEYPDVKPYKARLKYMFSFMGIIDLISVIPFYLPYFIKIDLRVVRVLRLFRLLRLLKLNRHSNSLKLIIQVFRRTKSDILITVFIVSLLLILSATLMYNIENEAQPEAFANIGEALWWAVATLTTVGYGDIYPVTGIGKILSGVIALLGIGIVALPTGIISSAYIEEIQHNRKKTKNDSYEQCPHCGKDLK
ncbi:MAG: voltage-gated potassium channel [Dokdonia sp.]|jgi:voltage-gated potassium channel